MSRPKFRYFVDRLYDGSMRRYRVRVARRNPHGVWSKVGSRRTFTRRGAERWAERQMRRVK